MTPSEPVESTGWANFDNFENSLSIENAVGEEKKSCDNELKEKVSETIVDSKEKDITATATTTIGDSVGNEKINDSANTEITGSSVPSNTEANLNSKSDEVKTIVADKNANPSKPPATNRYL